MTRLTPYAALASNGQLAILFVDASVPDGGALYEASMVSHPVSAERRGVPRMIIDDSVLVGSQEIPARLHGIIRAGLEHGGVPWPAIAGLAAVVASLPPPGPPTPGGATATDTIDGAPPVADEGDPGAIRSRPGENRDTPVAARGASDSAVEAVVQTRDRRSDTSSVLADLATSGERTVANRVRRDPVGNGLAIGALGVMVLVLGAVAAGLPARLGPRTPGLWLPLLALAGAGVAAYLTFVETTGATAVCGPVGDCNTVQQSPYARLFGVLPIGVLGLAGYGVILVLWVLGQEGRPAATLARRALVAAAMVGTGFSIYLTALEPFVIGATCLWCLSSAVTMTILLWLAAGWRAADPGRVPRST